MQTYTRYFENHNQYYSERVYQLFCEYVKQIEYGERLYEFAIPKIIKDKIDFITNLAKEISVSLFDLFKLFMDKYVFKLSFPYPGSNLIKLALAIIMTLGKKLHIKIKQQNKNKIEKEIAEVN